MVAGHLAILILCPIFSAHFCAWRHIRHLALTSHEIARYQIVRCVQRPVLSF